jgi:death on curing protein
MQAQATFGGEFLHEDLFAMAAAYAFHIAEAQAFIDGNKRTGVDAALSFLDMNGVYIDASWQAADMVYLAMMDIAAHKIGKADLASLLRGRKRR